MYLRKLPAIRYSVTEDDRPRYPDRQDFGVLIRTTWGLLEMNALGRMAGTQIESDPDMTVTVAACPR